MPDASPTHSTSRFVRACLGHPVDRTPVWFLRQAGRYMPEYMAVRRHHSLLDICRTPSIAAEVTITAAERLGVDAAIIFADLLLPFTPMGLDFEFVNGEGPIVAQPIRTLEQVQALRTDRTGDLRYVAHAIEKVARHFSSKSNSALSSSSALKSNSAQSSGSALKGNSAQSSGSALKGTGFSPSVTNAPIEGASAPEGAEGMDALGIIGFVGAPFTLASYMIEGGSSRNYIEAKRLMYASGRPSAEGRGVAAGFSPREGAAGTPGFSPGPNSAAWPLLMEKLVTVLVDYAAQQVEAGADVIQVFDSWAGALSVADYRAFCLAPTTELIRRIQALGVPVIYFGVDTASLLPTFRETGADVLGLDWRIPLDQARKTLGPLAVQGNLDPITLFAPEDVLEARVHEVLTLNAGRPGHIFNLGHGIVPGTPVENVIRVAELVKQYG